MLSSAYFRRQADICIRLSGISLDQQLSARLVNMAREYIATSEAIDRAAAATADAVSDHGDSPDLAPSESTPEASLEKSQTSADC